MYLIPKITTAAVQKQRLILPDGTTLTITLCFKAMQYGWFIQNLTYGSFQINGMRIVVSPNMFHQFRNLIPFGLACYTVANREPSLKEDFATGNAKLYLLDAAEVKQYTEILSGQIKP